VLLGPAAGNLEGIAQDAVHPAAGKEAFLNHHLAIGAFEAPPADGGVLPFGVFAHDDEVDVARLTAAQGRLDPGHQPHRADVGVLLEAAADREQQPPYGDVIRNPRKSHGAQEDGVVVAEWGLGC